MIMNVTTFKWLPGTTDDQVAALTRALDTFAALVPQLRSYRHGPNLRLRPGTVDYAVVSTLDAAEDLACYLDHPEHLRIGAEILKPMLESRQAVQMEFSPET
jgi:Stress responsive A/B Barrel Domain